MNERPGKHHSSPAYGKHSRPHELVTRYSFVKLTLDPHDTVKATLTQMQVVFIHSGGVLVVGRSPSSRVKLKAARGEKLRDVCAIKLHARQLRARAPCGYPDKGLKPRAHSGCIDSLGQDTGRLPPTSRHRPKQHEPAGRSARHAQGWQEADRGAPKLKAHPYEKLGSQGLCPRLSTRCYRPLFNSSLEDFQGSNILLNAFPSSAAIRLNKSVPTRNRAAPCKYPRRD